MMGIGVLLLLVGLLPATVLGLRENLHPTDNVKIRVLRYNLSFAGFWAMVFRGWVPECWVLCGNAVWFDTSTHNKITNDGLTWLSNKIHTVSFLNTTDVGRYVGISSDTAAVAATDLRLAGEKTTNGLGRALCVITIGTASAFSITNTCVLTFTDTTATTTALQKAGLFRETTTQCTPTTGTCQYAENTFASTDLNVNDQLQLTWSETYSN